MLRMIKRIKEKLKMIQRNQKILYLMPLELKELILLKWLYCPKQSTDLMRFLRKLPMTFFRELEL